MSVAGEADYLHVKHGTSARHSNGRAVFSAGNDLNSFPFRDTDPASSTFNVCESAECVPFDLKKPISMAEGVCLADEGHGLERH